MKIKDVSKVLGLASLVALGGALVVAGCDGATDEDQGGAGGQGGETATGGSSSGGTPGCGDPAFGGQGGEGGAASDTIEIEGTYTDNFGGTVVFGPESISWFGDVFTYVEIDAEARWVVTENGADNAFNPGLFSRFVWAFEGSSLYYCQDPYAAETADAASAADLPDSSDLETGCDGFPWSQLFVPCP